MSTIRYCRAPKSFPTDHWLWTQKRCSRDTASSVIAAFAGVSKAVARTQVDSLPAVGSGFIRFIGQTHTDYEDPRWISIRYDLVSVSAVADLLYTISDKNPRTA